MRCFEYDEAYLRRFASWIAVWLKSASRWVPTAVWRISTRAKAGQRTISPPHIGEKTHSA